MKGKQAVVDEMQTFLLNSAKEPLKGFLMQACELRSRTAIFELKDEHDIEKVLSDPFKGHLLELFHRLSGLLQTISFNNYDVHGILTGFFVGKPRRVELLTRGNIKKIYMLLLRQFPDKLVDLIIEVYIFFGIILKYISLS